MFKLEKCARKCQTICNSFRQNSCLFAKKVGKVLNFKGFMWTFTSVTVNESHRKN